MEFPTSINWASPFPFQGLFGGIFHFYSFFKRNFCKQTVENLIGRRVFAASYLVLHCLPMSHKKDAGLNVWTFYSRMCTSTKRDVAQPLITYKTFAIGRESEIGECHAIAYGFLRSRYKYEVRKLFYTSRNEGVPESEGERVRYANK